MRKLAIGLAAFALPLAAAAEVENYVFDAVHTVPYWETDHLTFATFRGRFDRVTGKFSIDRAAKTASLEVVIQTASVSTGDNERGGRARTRDEHLRSPDFFNVAEFPTMTYSSTAVKFKGDDPDAVEGNLTLLGVTKPVALRIERWKCGPDPRFAGKRFLCAGNASGSFKRSEFGMKTFLPTGIGDEVKVWMSVYAWRQ
ncbi:MAG: hypothetical protein A3D95_06790 [Betaproteobacteria bacterium RIFCSPHIGHO2_12_FULL_69_13]|nr:MAG: hypothetical protein A3D95_06790 [Betaproteobacteria bacterium RIFCSPHIGHO2_12_FULL_69_13]